MQCLVIPLFTSLFQYLHRILAGEYLFCLRSSCFSRSTFTAFTSSQQGFLCFPLIPQFPRSRFIFTNKASRQVHVSKVSMFLLCCLVSIPSFNVFATISPVHVYRSLFMFCFGLDSKNLYNALALPSPPPSSKVFIKPIYIHQPPIFTATIRTRSLQALPNPFIYDLST